MHSCKIYFNIILKHPFPLGFMIKILFEFHSLWFYNCYNTVLGYQRNFDTCVRPPGPWEKHVITHMWCKVQIIKLHIIKFSLSLCTKYRFPNYTVFLKHSQPMCFLCGERNKVFPWLQTFIIRKLRGIQTYFFFQNVTTQEVFFYNTLVHFNMCSFCCTQNV